MIETKTIIQGLYKSVFVGNLPLDRKMPNSDEMIKYLETFLVCLPTFKPPSRVPRSGANDTSFVAGEGKAILQRKGTPSQPLE